MSLKLFSASLLAAVGLSFAPAQADQVEFDYMSYELQTAGGVNALYARLARKAKLACRNTAIRSVPQKRAESECTLRLADEWVAKIDSPRLDRIHAGARSSLELAGS